MLAGSQPNNEVKAEILRAILMVIPVILWVT